MSDEWKRFLDRYPNANQSKFIHGVYSYNNEPFVRFVARDGSEYDVFHKGDFHSSIYFSDEMKKALGLPVDFPLELTVNPSPSLPIPAVDFNDQQPLNGLVLKEQLSLLKIFVTPKDSFTASVRDIFTNIVIKHTTSKECYSWLNAPNMKYWTQQLNFAVWCATTGCGVSLRLLSNDNMTDSGLKLPPQVRSIIWFHVYFTIRRILSEMGGIQGSIALPGDSPFDEKDNRYDIPSYKRICKEFNVPSGSDFRFNHGANNGLGSVYIWATGLGPLKTDSHYPGFNKFSSEGGEASKGNLLQYILNGESSKQYDYFITSVSNGLTSAGQSRLNQSIEALVYCVLGSQVNVRSSILGNTGSAQEVRREFLVLLEDAITLSDITNSVGRFQLAVQEAKVKLDLAISPGTWLLPSKMVINTESIIGYNNDLKRAKTSMKLGVNSDVNVLTKPVGIKHNLGKSKVMLPHALVSKHKPAYHVKNDKEVNSPIVQPTKPLKKSLPASPVKNEKEVNSPIVQPTKPLKSLPAKPDNVDSKHETNIAVLTIVFGGLAWLLFR